MDFFKVVSAVATGLGDVAKAVVDVPVGMVIGAAEGLKEASSKIDSVSTPGEGVNAVFGLLASPVTGAVAGGTKEIITAPGKVVQGVADSVEKAFKD